jgi:hypothetical protein
MLIKLTIVFRIILIKRLKIRVISKKYNDIIIVNAINIFSLVSI